MDNGVRAQFQNALGDRTRQLANFKAGKADFEEVRVEVDNHDDLEKALGRAGSALMKILIIEGDPGGRITVVLVPETLGF